MATSILVIEDDVTNLMIITKALENASYHVLQAQDGEAGIRKLVESTGVKIILLDWMLPGMDGIDVLKKIRENQKYDSVRVIMQTGNGAAENVQEAVAAGADDYIVKPIDPAILLAKVLKAVKSPRQPKNTG